MFLSPEKVEDVQRENIYELSSRVSRDMWGMALDLSEGLSPGDFTDADGVVDIAARANNLTEALPDDILGAGKALSVGDIEQGCMVVNGMPVSRELQSYDLAEGALSHPHARASGLIAVAMVGVIGPPVGFIHPDQENYPGVTAFLTNVTPIKGETVAVRSDEEAEWHAEVSAAGELRPPGLGLFGIRPGGGDAITYVMPSGRVIDILREQDPEVVDRLMESRYSASDGLMAGSDMVLRPAIFLRSSGCYDILFPKVDRQPDSRKADVRLLHEAVRMARPVGQNIKLGQWFGVGNGNGHARSSFTAHERGNGDMSRIRTGTRWVIRALAGPPGCPVVVDLADAA